MNGQLVPLTEAKVVVALARENGDVMALARLAAMGDAVQKLALAKGAREDALNAGEVYVRAMVALAGMDHEQSRQGAHLQVDASDLPLGTLEPHARAEWRKLAAGADVADLDDLITYFRGDEGNAGFSRAALVRAWKRLTTGDAMAVHYSSATDDWATPRDLFDELDAEFGFTLDVCALPESAKCARYFTPADDGLSQDWTGVCWMNPPYGDVIGAWVRKAYESAQHGATVVCLVPARVDTGWFWSYCRYGEVRLLRGRLKFGDATGSAPFPSAIVVFGPHATPHIICWERAHELHAGPGTTEMGAP